MSTSLTERERWMTRVCLLEEKLQQVQETQQQKEKTYQDQIEAIQRQHKQKVSVGSSLSSLT